MGNPASGSLFDYENYALVEPEYAELEWGDMGEKDELRVTVYNSITDRSDTFCPKQRPATNRNGIVRNVMIAGGEWLLACIERYNPATTIDF
jgi:hypothetical protein